MHANMILLGYFKLYWNNKRYYEKHNQLIGS